jgi:hypothetical protein
MTPPTSQELEIAIVGVIGAVIGGVAGGLAPLLATWLRRPRLVIDFKSDNNNIVVARKIEGGTLIEDIWLRVRVENTGYRRAIDSQVYLTALYQVRKDGTRETDPVLKDAKILQWAGGSKKTIAIPKSVDFYSDLLHLPKPSGGWGMMGLYTDQADLEKYTGTYEFHLIVSADNAEPKICKIRIDCKEPGEGFKAYEV